MTEPLSITSSQMQAKVSVTVFHLSGVLDASSEDTLCENARQAFESGTRYLLLDFQDLTFISSAGLRALHNIFKMCTPMEEFNNARYPGGPYKSPYFKLAGANPDIYYVLNLAGFLHNIPFYPTLQDALDSFS